MHEPLRIMTSSIHGFVWKKMQKKINKIKWANSHHHNCNNSYSEGPLCVIHHLLTLNQWCWWPTSNKLMRLWNDKKKKGGGRMRGTWQSDFRTILHLATPKPTHSHMVAVKVELENVMNESSSCCNAPVANKKIKEIPQFLCWPNPFCPHFK